MQHAIEEKWRGTMFAWRHFEQSARTLLQEFLDAKREIQVTRVFRELELWCIVSLPRGG
jgi:hypothetical protein